MDVISQAVLGASLSQSFTKPKLKLVSALVVGALAGMAPDLDILIRSNEDPLLFLTLLPEQSEYAVPEQSEYAVPEQSEYSAIGFGN